MNPAAGLNPELMAELEVLIAKLSRKATTFTPREHQLMELLREHRDVILPQIRTVAQMYKGANRAGREKLENLIEGIEKICRS